ncbi:MAG TPA: alkaline phosphatase family protein [Solirubrobacteraceae bacterium]|nr:alkaline phosphatase family protein [Solirubrobacteraceae bacterium]
MPHERSGLERRHDELVEQVRGLHWDLGGLAYEMAIRDHFRLDVLMRRAAMLQERDAELAEVERLLHSERRGIAGACPACSAPHSRGAVFCWQCGRQLMESAASQKLPVAARAPEATGSSDCGAPTERLPAIAVPVIADALVGEEPAAGAAAPGAPSSSRDTTGGSSGLPSPRVSALLVLVFLAFGTILGGAAGSRVDETLAASGPERLLLPAAAPSAEASVASQSGSSASEAPPVEAEATPSASAPRSGKGTSEQTSAEESSPQNGEGEGGSEATGSKPATVKHVFVIMLADQPYAALFGPSSKMPYLAHTLESKGELLSRYYSVAHQELAGEIALLSGQGATPQTEENCPAYTDLAPATVGAEGQARGEGCVYPEGVQTLLDQLRAKQLSWRAYIQGLEEAPAKLPACAHPALGQPDPSSFAEALAPQAGAAPSPTATQPTAATPGAPPGAISGPYATFRNPLVYFHSLIDAPSCQALDVGIANLGKDLTSARGAPAFSYISPDLCHDGSPTPCAPGATAGTAPAEAFLKGVVPEILASSSYKEGGLIVITADQAPAGGELADSSSCCGQPRFPDLPQSAIEEASPTPLRPPGGGQVGALLLSPLVKAGSASQEPANTYSLLRLIEDELGLSHLGYAGSSRLTALEPSTLFSKAG